MGEMFQATLRLGGVFGTLRRSRRAELEPEDLPAPLTSFRSSGNEALFAEACARWDAALGAYEKARKCTAASLAGSKRQQLGRIFVRSQLYGGLRRWCAAGVAISALGGLLGTIGRFLVLQSIVHGVQYGTRAEVLRGALLFAAVSVAEGACAVYSRQILAGNVAHFLAMLPCGVAALLGGVGILVAFLGVGSLVCLGCMVCVLNGQRLLTLGGKRLERPMMKARDRRVAGVKQAVECIKAVKFYAWEEQYRDAIGDRRDAQLKLATAYRAYVILSVNIGKCFPVVAGAITILTVAAQRGGTISAAKAFGALAVFQTLRGPRAEPEPRARAGGGAAARRRSLRTTSESLAAAAPALAEEAKDELLEPAGEPAFSLALDDLTVRRGSVVAVVGPVGAGKSTAVEAALGRVEASGDVTCDASVGYAPQDPFVAAGTILENVLLGRALDEAAFAKAVNLAAFERDLELLPDGRDTVVGERGTTLSGGQQHRLGLHFLPECDQVVLVDDGAVLADGPAAALAAKAWDEGSFGAFVRDALAGGGGDAPSKSVDELVAPETPSARGRALDEDKADALVKKEKVARGVVSAKVLLTFFRAVGYWRIGAIVFGYCFAGAILAGSDVILARWTGSRSTRTAYPVAYAVGCVCYLCVLISSSLAGVANPSGRILSRFAADFDVVDIDWGNMFDGFLSMATMFFMLVVMISAIVPYLIPINLFVSVGLIRTLNVINTANRDVKRIANNAVSPTVTTAAEMARGRRVVSRALRCGAFFRERQRRHVDAMLGGFFQSTCISQAAYGSATLWCSLMALSAALLIALSRAGRRMSIMATSLERVAEYLPKEDGGVVPQEPARDGDLDALADAPGAPWPASGRVEFVDVCLRYRPGLPLSLRDASFDVAAGAKEAVLMSGTAKDNCDPFDEFAEGAVADALEAVGLARSLLHAFLGETSLSTGERQLLALARALLRKSAVVAFDEATAHVDASTDAKIQAVVETQFPRSTLLAIAHRLHTVIGFDRIVVMDRGTIAEQGPPLERLDRARGPFATMTAALGAAAKAELRDIACGALDRATLVVDDAVLVDDGPAVECGCTFAG
ncbi:ATPase [Aureococcus anophagefferens]|nr:ATPase [Aureococcus anophagefferens]